MNLLVNVDVGDLARAADFYVRRDCGRHWTLLQFTGRGSDELL